jgi:hypothetical protein
MSEDLCDDICDEIYTDVITSFSKIIEKAVKNRQTEYQIENYPSAKANTRMDCIVCGGTYTPRNRALHNNTKRHKKHINLIKRNFITRPS